MRNRLRAAVIMAAVVLLIAAGWLVQRWEDTGTHVRLWR